ncbi:MAG: hypothetical protein ACOY42_02040 [Pseudomonadota bacterium]
MAAAKIKTPDGEKKATALLVRTRRGDVGLRRAGRVFGATPVRIELAELAEHEIEALRNEPRLIVVEVGPATETPENGGEAA